MLTDFCLTQLAAINICHLRFTANNVYIKCKLKEACREADASWVAIITLHVVCSFTPYYSHFSKLR